jgi:murein DD-endopeptidase MepM/ murein hydrolase activator NlpD
LKEERDDLRQAVRVAHVKVSIDGSVAELISANYHLPQTVAGVQIDCPITKGYYEKTDADRWGLGGKDARLRLWPAGSPLLAPGTFVYPIKQRWFASDTQMGNEPVFVDGPEIEIGASGGKIYYHSGLDLDGAERLVEVLAAVDGVVVVAGKKAAADHPRGPIEPAADYVVLHDRRNWYYWYCHLSTIDVTAGQTVKKGQKIGLVGKEGGSGGCAHLHFEIKCRQPSGLWGTEDGYAYIWEAYAKEYAPPLLAVARPHRLARVGQTITLNGSKSRSFAGEIVRYEWTFTDGGTAAGARVDHQYTKPGTYSEVLKVVDSKGNVDYDFAVVQVFDGTAADKLPPTINANYYPTFGLKPGDPVTFHVRTFATRAGREVWDFGDGSSAVETQSDGNVDPHAKDGYAWTVHRYAKAGHYLVRVERTGHNGARAVAHVHVRVGD